MLQPLLAILRSGYESKIHQETTIHILWYIQVLKCQSSNSFFFFSGWVPYDSSRSTYELFDRYAPKIKI